MGIAIVCMVDPRRSNNQDVSQNDEFSFLTDDVKSVAKREAGTYFDWSKAMQGFILSSYFYGYILTQIPSGWLAIRYGPKIVLFIAILGASIATLLTPLAATFNVYALVAVRFLTGFFHVKKNL
jgi:MFS family permease